MAPVLYIHYTAGKLYYTANKMKSDRTCRVFVANTEHTKWIEKAEAPLEFETATMKRFIATTPAASFIYFILYDRPWIIIGLFLIWFPIGPLLYCFAVSINWRIVGGAGRVGKVRRRSWKVRLHETVIMFEPLIIQFLKLNTDDSWHTPKILLII